MMPNAGIQPLYEYCSNHWIKPLEALIYRSQYCFKSKACGESTIYIAGCPVLGKWHVGMPLYLAWTIISTCQGEIHYILFGQLDNVDFAGHNYSILWVNAQWFFVARFQTANLWLVNSMPFARNVCHSSVKIHKVHHGCLYLTHTIWYLPVTDIGRHVTKYWHSAGELNLMW